MNSIHRFLWLQFMTSGGTEVERLPSENVLQMVAQFLTVEEGYLFAKDRFVFKSLVNKTVFAIYSRFSCS